MDDFGGLFEQLFDAVGEPGRTADLQVRVPVSVAEAFEGCERTVQAARRETCGACQGSMCAPGADKVTCTSCDGSGERAVEQGAFVIRTGCSDCGARGFRTDALCEPCEGTGATSAEVEFTVQIPGGVSDGHQVRLRGAGNRITEEPGDVYLTIAVARDSRFVRVDADVFVVVELSAEELAEGGVFDVPHWTEECQIELDPGTPPGAERVLDGWGPVKLGAKRVPIPTHDDPYRSVDVRAHRGDLIVQFQVPEPEADVAPWAPAPPPKRDHEAARSPRGALVVLVVCSLLFAFIAWKLLES